MPSTRRATRPRGLRYPRGDSSGVRYPHHRLVGARGRVEVVRAADLPQELVTPVSTAFSRVTVVQSDGDPTIGSVALAATDRAGGVRLLPIEVRYRIVAPDRTERMLAAGGHGNPATSRTAAPAQALATVLHRAAGHRGLATATVKIAGLAEALAPPR